MFADELGTADRLLSIAGGVLLLFLGVAMLSSHLVRPLAVFSSPIGRWAAFVFTVLAWPFFLLPYWLLRYGAWGPGTAAAPRAARSSAARFSTRCSCRSSSSCGCVGR